MDVALAIFAAWTLLCLAAGSWLAVLFKKYEYHSHVYLNRQVDDERDPADAWKDA